MPAALFNIQPLLPALARGATLLTPNNRLRNEMRKAYARLVQKPTVRTPAIYSIGEWINLQWQTLRASGAEAAARQRLNSPQERQLWQQVLEDDGRGDHINLQPLIRQLMEAHSHLVLWAIPREALEAAAGMDDAPLLPWLDAFQQKLDAHGALTREQSIPLIATAFADGTLPPVTKLVLVEADNIPPATQQLLEQACPALIHAADQSTTPPHPSTLYRIGCNDFAAELDAAARWSRDILQTDSDARIGIVVPTLGQQREQVEKAFTRVFEPQWLNPQTPRYTPPFNISTGVPLGTTPLIGDTLLLLDLHQPRLPTAQWQKIFHSPFYADMDGELPLRAALTEKVLQQSDFEIAGSRVRQQLQQLCEASDSTLLQSYSQRFQTVDTLHKRQPERASAEHWVHYLLQQLDNLGWPGSRTLDSVEYQQIQQWYRLLDELITLDTVQPAISFAEFLQQARQAAAQTPFQAELKDSPVHILGTLEAAGLQFTHCWIAGMNNQDWPPAPNPNPLLPITLQRQYQLPRATVSREAAYAQSLTEKLLASAETVVASYSVRKEESPALPSPLIASLPEKEAERTIQNTTPLENWLQSLSGKLEWVDCSTGPALGFDNNTGNNTSGGSDLIKQQALCPFNAFARYRLGARMPEPPQLGFTASIKGNLVHDLLKQVWDKLEDQHTLLQTDSTALRTLVNNTANTLMAGQVKKDIRLLGDPYYQLEQQHLVNLVCEWLQFEKNRPVFRTQLREADLQLDLAGLHLRLRLDRMDVTDDGDTLLIDYKTGKPTIGRLTGERPDEPQLWLYAIACPEPVSAITFAQINAEKMRFTGVGDIAEQKSYRTISSPEKLDLENWTQALEQARQNMHSLAEEFTRGQCPVQFKDDNAGRYQEDLLPLNRYHEVEFINWERDT